MSNSIRALADVSRPKVVGSVSLAHAVNEFFSIVIPPIIPLLVTDLGISYTRAGLLVTIFFLMYSIFQLPAGLVADKIGKQRILVIGLVGMSMGVFLASTAPNYEILLVAQAIAGICGSTFHPAGMALISDGETRETEGRAMGIFGSAGKVGTMASPLLIGGLAAVGRWRIALAGAAFLGLLATLGLIPAFRGKRTSSFKDSIQLMSGDQQSGDVSRRIRSALKSVEVPPISPEIVLLFCITIMISLQGRAIQTFTTTYIVASADTSISIGNVAFFAFLLGGGVSQLVSGGLADEFNRGLIGGATAIGAAVLVVGTVFVTRVDALVPHALLVVVLVGWLFLIGAMMYTSSPIKNALVSEQAQKEYSGGLFGVIQTASAIGSATGPVLFGSVATEWGIVTAYPIIGAASALLAGLFLVLAVME